MFVHVTHKKEEHNLLLGHEAVQATGSMLLSMLHSNPAIWPAEVLAVCHTGYCNQLLHVKARQRLIYLMLWILNSFSWEPIAVFVCMT